MRYTFEWDPIKAKQNDRRHKVGFDRASEVFLDSLALSVKDEEHSGHEQRWVTVGMDRRGSTLVIIHTFSEISAEECRVRIISARKATRRETRQYQETQR